MKRIRIKEFFSKGKADLCLLQETKIQDISEDVVLSFWGPGEVDWSAKGPIGRSGGILILWKKDLLVSIFRFCGERFLGLCCNFKGQKCYVVNVYSSCVLTLKRILWDRLIELHSR